ncbi:MAG: hypothetical protein IKS70_03375, partial [Bacteroides sp.]|nr:hypothetical protein [Bacteroides sp.]
LDGSSCFWSLRGDGTINMKEPFSPLLFCPTLFTIIPNPHLMENQPTHIRETVSGTIIIPIIFTV